MRFIVKIAPLVLYIVVAYCFYKLNEDLLKDHFISYLTPVATLASILVALFKDRYFSFWDKPVLTVCRKELTDSLSKSPRQSGECYVLVVKNDGKSVAKNAFAQVELIESSDGFYKNHVMPRMNLCLSYYGKETKTCDIFPNLKEVFDILYKNATTGQYVLTTSIAQNGIILNNHSYVFKLTIGADNANFIDKTLIIDLTQTNPALELKPWTNL